MVGTVNPASRACSVASTTWPSAGAGPRHGLPFVPVIKRLAAAAPMTTEPLVINGRDLTIAEVAGVARGIVAVQLSDEPEVMAALDQIVRVIRQAVDDGARIYGVTTGFGAWRTS